MRFLLVPLWSMLLLIGAVYGDASLNIGVVDEQILIDKYEKSEMLVKRLEERFRKEEQKMQVLENKIEGTEKELVTAGAARKEKLFDALRRMKVEFKVNKEMLTEMFTGQRNAYTLQVVADIEKALQVYGEDNGYDLILRKATPGPRGNDHRIVFFNKESLNITSKVLRYLNTKFRQEEPAK